MNKTKVDIGLDIGIASVGWAITNVETLEIIEHGVRLFPTVDDPMDSKLKNEERREARSARRQVNRRRALKRDFIKSLIKSRFISDVKIDKNDIKSKFVDEFTSKYLNNAKLQSMWKQESKELPYTLFLRQKALHNKVSREEFIAILYWYINHRGFKYEIAEEKDKKDKELEKIKDSKKLPIENQISYFKKFGHLNGEFNRTFHQKEYLKEIGQIFISNSDYKEIKNDFIDFFKRQRSFEQGPGNEKSPTKYGRFYNLNKTTLKLEKVDANKVPNSIWENTVGKCTFFPIENRAPKKSFTSEIFNLLNELGNVEVKETGEVLSENNKIEIIKFALKKGVGTKGVLNELYKRLDVDPKDAGAIKGIPKDKSDKRFLTEIESIKKLREFLPEKFTSFEYLFKDSKNINEDNIIDKILEVFSKSKVVETREKLLKKSISKFLNEVQIAKLASETKLKGLSNTHALSFYAMRKMVPDFISRAKMNQMIWAKENDIKFNENKDYGSNYLKSEWINDIIITPSVKRAFRQTTKVLNAIFQLAKDRQWKIRSIVIEMAREAKNKDAKEQEKNRQKYFENNNKKILELIGERNISNHTLNKLWLLDQQKGHDAYTGEKIEMEDVIKKPGDFDIDHIIPYSQSYSNNRSNRVLTKQQVNQQKTNLSSYQYFQKHNPKNYDKMKKMWQEWYCDRNNKDRKIYIDYTKYDFLKSEIDYSKPENQLGFIQRNLVDTRYTTKAIMEALKAFSENEKNSFDFKVKAINGKMTSFARNKIGELKRPDGIEFFEEKEISQNGKKKIIKAKSRVWNGHHAEDAYLVTILNSQFNDSKTIEKILSSPKKFSRFKKNEKNKEWKDDSMPKFSVLIEKIDNAKKELDSKMEKVRFSRMVEKPKNTKLFNETLYKGKKNESGFIDKCEKREILKQDFKAHYYFGESPKHKEQLMIFRHNRDLYNELNKIYKNYYEKNNLKPDGKKNPFLEINNEKNAKYLEVTYTSNSKNAKEKLVTKKIKKLSLISQEGQKGKNPSEIVFANNNGNSFYESLDWVAVNMYKNKHNKYKLIPINALNCTFKTLENGKVEWISKDDILEKQLEKNQIENPKPVATFFKGDTLVDKNDTLLYICGANIKIDLIETKFLHRGKIESDKSRGFMTINKQLIGSHLIKNDILGIKRKTKFVF